MGLGRRPPKVLRAKVGHVIEGFHGLKKYGELGYLICSFGKIIEAIWLWIYKGKQSPTTFVYSTTCTSLTRVLYMKWHQDFPTPFCLLLPLEYSSLSFSLALWYIFLHGVGKYITVPWEQVHFNHWCHWLSSKEYTPNSLSLSLSLSMLV